MRGPGSLHFFAGPSPAGPTFRQWFAFGSSGGSLAAGFAPGPIRSLVRLGSPERRVASEISGGIAAGNVIKGTFRQTYTPHDLLGRVTVSMQLLNFGTIPLGALLGGALGAAVGLRPTMWVMTAGVAAAGLILLIGPLRKSRDLPTGYGAPVVPAPAEPVPA